MATRNRPGSAKHTVTKVLVVQLPRCCGSVDEETHASFLGRYLRLAVELRFDVVVLDASQTTVAGARLLGNLVQARKRASEAGIRLAVAGAGRRSVLLAAIEATKLDRVLTIYPTIEQALSDLGPSSPGRSQVA